MKKRYLLVGSLAFSLLLSRAQNETSNSFKVNETEVELVYSHYLQDGDNSAVTGGEGTERLTVYGPSFSLKRSFGNNVIDFQLGADIISSASTDNIDFVVSSASRLDARSYTNINYSRVFEKSKLSINGGIGFSLESDYFSFGKFLGATKTSEDDMQTFSAQLQIFNDDLRWGRLQGDGPHQLIYPIELRFQEWYDDYHRNSYNLNLGYTRIIDQRNIIGLFSAISLQEGLLATPFHRVLFNDGTRAVEQLPSERYKGTVAVKWNKFIRGNIITKSTVNSYVDNFGVVGISLDNETAIKLNAKWTLVPSFRFYTQQASKYFSPIRTHSPNSEFYTSDFDLSKFNTFKVGLGWNHSPYGQKNGSLNAFTMRYFYYHRSNGLSAHSLSISLQFKKNRNKAP